jgi:hypothetical protein
MKKTNLKELKKHKAEEFFSLSHRLLDVARELSEYHAAELSMNIEHAKELAISAAKNDFRQIEQLQKRAAVQAAQRMKVFQRNAKSLLRKIGNESAEKTEKYIEKAHDSLLDWLEESEKRMPVGAEKLSKVVRDISSAGAKAFKEGRKLINNAADNLDELMDKTAGHEAPVKKAAPRKSTTQKVDLGSAEVAPKIVPKE